MDHLPIDPEEMAKRRDEDVIASLNMVGEGAPSYDTAKLTKEVAESSSLEEYH